jgi:ATP-dependent Clp protease protease subunit
MSKKYYSMERVGEVLTVNIYGDITSIPWFENDVTADSIVRQIDAAQDVSQIDVYINSYGGEVAEGLAIYNALKRHKAKVRTICDGFACSIASVIFMAGEERIMNESSLLMIHNAWTSACGNAAELRKLADDMEKITQASVEAYKAHSNLSEDEIKELMDAESWILPTEALEYGFATSIEKVENKNANQSAKFKLFEVVKAYMAEENPEDEEEQEDTEETEESPEDEETEETEDEESEETEETEEEEQDEEEPDNNEQEKTAQRWSGFFNAISKM